MLRTLSGSICAGLLIAVGGSVFLACDNRYIGAVLFSVALLCICYMDYYLFTGKIGYLADDHSKRNAAMLALGLAGNLASAYAFGALIRYALPALGDAAELTVSAKLEQSLLQTFIRAAFCGVLMYLAVHIFRKKNTPIGILFCIPVFILSGFEHSIADMFYFGASGLGDVRALGFFTTAVLGNSVGSLILPLAGRIGGKNET